MPNKIFYFTGTGNSLQVAKALARELGDTELIPIPRVINSEIDFSSADKIGIVFPVYAMGAPRMLVKFTRMLKTEGKYIFAVCTSGGFPGPALKQIDDILRENELFLSAGFAVTMPGNYIPMYGAVSKEKQQKIFEKAEQKIKASVPFIREGRKCKIEGGNFLIDWLTSFINKASMPKFPELDKKFWVDEKKCTSCGICVKVCPVKNIKISAKKPPVWLRNCEQCFACLQWCPNEAVQIGRTPVNRKRYHHPDVKAEELFMPEE